MKKTADQSGWIDELHARQNDKVKQGRRIFNGSLSGDPSEYTGRQFDRQMGQFPLSLYLFWSLNG